MRIQFEVPDYSDNDGFIFSWEDNFTIKVTSNNDTVIIAANKEGLLSLAKNLVALAQDNVQPGYDIHFDDINSLETGSTELIIVKL